MGTLIPQSFGSPHVQRSLAAAGFTTLQSLAAKTRRGIRYTEGIGPSALARIAVLLQSHGLAFREEVPNERQLLMAVRALWRQARAAAERERTELKR